MIHWELTILSFLLTLQSPLRTLLLFLLPLTFLFQLSVPLGVSSVLVAFFLVPPLVTVPLPVAQCPVLAFQL